MAKQATITLEKRQLEEAQILFQAVINHPDIEGALKRILDTAYCKLVDAEADVIEGRVSAPAAAEPHQEGGSPAISALLPFEEPLRMVRGQALALTAGMSDALGDDVLVSAGEALQCSIGAICEQWEEALERSQKGRAS